MTARISIFLIVTVMSWYGMMAFHEAGHCLGAVAAGGPIRAVDMPLLGFSQTHYRGNPHPLFVAWSGPVGGAVVSLALSALSLRLRGRPRDVLLYFCGFCLIANGIYIGLGGFDRVGDCAELLNHGARLWQLILFGFVATCLGGYCWHLLGPVRGWFEQGGSSKREE